MSHRRKNLVQHIIQKNNAERFFDTRPELEFQELCAKAGIKLESRLKPITISGWHITPDRKVADSDVVVEIDGRYHDTEIQRRKMEWRDGQLVSRGFRVFHVPAQLLIAEGVGDRRKFWPYVLFALADFLLSKEEKVRRMIA